MPFTVNGIGTGYYFSARRCVQRGTCEPCGRYGLLRYYDVGEWFCFVFVPLIPLGRYRITRECPSCRRHFRGPLKEFNAECEAQLAPLRAAAGGGPADRVRLARALAGLTLYDQAEREALAGLLHHEHDAELRWLAGLLIAGRGDLAGALPHLQRAAAQRGNDAETQRVYAAHLLDAGRPAEAVEPLRIATRLRGDDNRAWELLGDAHRALGEHEPALAAYERARAGLPDEALDPGLLAGIRASKLATGAALSPLEKRAGRKWWWPFGGARPYTPPRTPPRTPANPTAPAGPWWPRNRVAVLIIGGLLLALATAVAVAVSLARRRITVVVDNSFDRPLAVSLCGVEEKLAANQRRQFIRPPGRCAVAASDGAGWRESFSEQLAPGGPFATFTALLDGRSARIYLYAPAGARSYIRNEYLYATTPEEAERGYLETPYLAERWIVQDGVEDLFREPPKTLDLQNGVAKRRVHFGILEVTPMQLAGYYRAQKDEAAALRQARIAALARPCDPAVREAEVEFILETAPDEALAEARAWADRCPAERLRARRTYQQVRRARGELAAARDESRTEYERTPDDPVAIYLYSRLLDDPPAEIALMRRALALKPDFAWANCSLAYNLLQLGRASEARAAAARCLESPDRVPDHLQIFASTVAASGESAGADALIVSRFARDSEGGDARLAARVGVALSAGDADAAGKLLPPLDEKSPGLHLDLRLPVLLTRGDVVGARRVAELLGKAGASDDEMVARTQIALYEGDPRAAVEAVRRFSANAPPELRARGLLNATEACLAGGDSPRAAGMLGELRTLLGISKLPARSRALYAALADGLDAGAPAQTFDGLPQDLRFSFASEYHLCRFLRLRADGRAPLAQRELASGLAGADYLFTRTVLRKLSARPGAGNAMRAP